MEEERKSEPNPTWMKFKNSLTSFFTPKTRSSEKENKKSDSIKGEDEGFDLIE
jgi:hypothetical protein